VLFGNNGNSYTVCVQSDMCVYTHIVHSIETLVGQIEKNIGTAVCAACQGIFCLHVSQVRQPWSKVF